MIGFDLMTEEQRREWSDLEEAHTHSDTMRFTELDAIHLAEYETLAERLETEHRLEQAC